MQPSQFLEPAVLHALKDLRLAAKTVVTGVLHGLHQSRKDGSGIEFNQHRSYQPGDDLRRVDWKMYARSDRFYIRESQAEQNMAVRIILDASASMGHQDQGLSKFDYAKLLTAALAYLVGQQGDLLEFQAIQGNKPTELQERRPERQFDGLIHILDKLQPEGRWPDPAQIVAQTRRARIRSLLIVITDFYEQNQELRQSLEIWKTTHREILVLQPLCRNELEFPFTGDCLFEDLETKKTIEINATRLKASYQARFHQHLQSLQQDLAGHGIELQRFYTDEPLQQALRSFLLSRAVLR